MRKTDLGKGVKRRQFLKGSLAAGAALALPTTLSGRKVLGANEDRSPDLEVIDSIPDLRRAMQESGQKIRMNPGTYRVEDTWPDDERSVFVVDGSDNTFDMRDVTIEVPTEIYHDMRGPVHSLAGYRILGDNNTFEGATFVNTGDQAPHRSLPEFTVRGDDNQFRNCRFIIRGSAPYGYGDLFGKGGGSTVRLRKHSAMQVRGDRTLIEDCRFDVKTFGHGIFMQGAQDTVIRNVHLEGEIRPTNELYEETSGPAAEHDYKRTHPAWKEGESIPRDEMLHLTEDGIRAYTRGTRDGEERGTGSITVENCTVVRMRGGITLTLAGAPAKVEDSTVIDAEHAYSLPNGSVVRNSRGNAAYGPLLSMPYNHKRDVDIQLELIQSEKELGDHPLAAITGRGHEIRITVAEDYDPDTLRPIVLGRVLGGRYTPENSSAEEVRERNRATGITLENRTPHPVELTAYAENNTVRSLGPVDDEGEENRALEQQSDRERRWLFHYSRKASNERRLLIPAES